MDTAVITLPKRVGQSAQPIFAPRCDHEVETFGGKYFGERGADAGGGAGNQDGSPVHGFMGARVPVHGVSGSPVLECSVLVHGFSGSTALGSGSWVEGSAPIEIRRGAH